ncbi:uncharacterized protein LOC128396781 [Panonychus citri]|uniref:uncharacterized protein LOC128396781 n=1 Tax=Panonychus citri TaxID=50023 RepID=UPI0023079B12|nr:uncharacterized protein LOC128396781 [Panonychus citri]
MTQAKSRKRSHEEEEGCLPISKRMSKLQLETSDETSISPQSAINEKPVYFGKDSDNLMDPSSLSCPYDPTLSVDQNPLYFESNRVLFEAHKNRLQRQRIRIK